MGIPISSVRMTSNTSLDLCTCSGRDTAARSLDRERIKDRAESVKILLETDLIPFKRFRQGAGIPTSLMVSLFPELKVANDKTFALYSANSCGLRLRKAVWCNPEALGTLADQIGSSELPHPELPIVV